MTPALPCHLPAGHRVKSRGIGAVRMVWEMSRDSSCRKPPGTQHQAQFMRPAPLSCGRIITKAPQISPGVTGSWPNPCQDCFPPGYYSQQCMRSMAVPDPALLGFDISGIGKTSLKVHLWCHHSRLAFGTWEQGSLGSWSHGGGQSSSAGCSESGWLQKMGNEEKLDLGRTFKTRGFHSLPWAGTPSPRREEGKTMEQRSSRAPEGVHGISPSPGWALVLSLPRGMRICPLGAGCAGRCPVKAAGECSSPGQTQILL